MIPRIVGIDTRTGAVTLNEYALAGAASPDGAFVIAERFRRRTDEIQSAAYMLVDVRKGTTPLWTYPDPGLRHQRQSEFYWVDQSTAAFVDLAGDRALVIAVSVDRHGGLQRAVAKPLDTETIVNVADIDSDAPAASAIAEASIQKVDGPGLTLRLTFPKRSALKVRQVDVEMWR
jgi:hypothetical protein